MKSGRKGNRDRDSSLSATLRIFLACAVGASCILILFQRNKDSLLRLQLSKENVNPVLGRFGGVTTDGSGAARTSNGRDIPATVFSRSIDYHDINIEFSSYTCDDEEPEFQVCIFHNVLIHEGWLLYVVQDEKAVSNTSLPDPNLWEIGNTHQKEFTVADRFVVISKRQLLTRLRTGSGISKSKGMLLVAEYDTGILQRFRTFQHWFWSMTGASNILVRLCANMNICSPSQVSEVAIIMPGNQNSRPAFRMGPLIKMRAVEDLMSCFGPMFMINKAHAKGIAPRDNRVVIIHRLLAGIGRVVSQPHVAKGPREEIRYKSPDNVVGLARTRFLRQCAGLPPDPLQASKVSILLVNRPHRDGRHIIGLDDVHDRLVRGLPAPLFSIKNYYPRAETMASQAAVFASSNIVVVPHGSANANLAFLPHQAVVFALFAVPSRHDLDKDHIFALPSPPYNVSLVSVDCQESIQANVVKVSGVHGFQDLAAELKAFFLGDPTMSAEKRQALQKHLKMSTKTWMKYVDYTPNATALAEQVMEAAWGLNERLVTSA